jgi:hypothetical protein
MRPVACAFVVLLLLIPGLGAAQERHGFWFNGGLGYGSLGCDNCGSREGGLSGGLSLGGTLSPKWLLGVGTSGWYKDLGGATLTIGSLDARVRFYPSRTGNFFLTGGLGLGTISLDVGGIGSDSETGASAILGIGYDIRLSPGLSLTPYWNGFAVQTSNADANVGQLGLSLTAHKFRAPEKAHAEPVVDDQPRSAPVPATKPVSPPADTARATPAREAGYTALPQGTNFVGDARIQVFYPVGCAAQHAIPPDQQVYFQTYDGAVRDGFRRSGDC